MTEQELVFRNLKNYWNNKENINNPINMSGNYDQEPHRGGNPNGQESHKNILNLRVM